MATAAQRIADLEQQVADLAALVEQYYQSACVIRSFEDVLGAPLTTASRQQSPRPRHLTVVAGGRS
jgi:hypothetical protein